MRRQARAETTATKASSLILIGGENKVKYASQSDSQATDKCRLSVNSLNPLFHLND